MCSAHRFETRRSSFKSEFDEQSPDGISLLIYCTARSELEQAIHFRKARSLAEIKARAARLTMWGYPDLSEILITAPPQYGHRRVVTWAGPGESLHQHLVAFDACPFDGRKLLWGKREHHLAYEFWDLYGRLALELGLNWAGSWPRKKREMPHCQDGHGLDIHEWMATTYADRRAA